MASYYYLISSLPMLKSDGSMPMSFDNFLEQCKPNVSVATYKDLSALSESKSKHPMLKAWSSFYNTLMEELAFQRSQKLGKPCAVPGDREPALVNTVADVLAAPTPLVSEQMLLDLEFKRIDSLLGFHTFDDYYLFAYAIKLRLMERQTIFKHDEGKAEFMALLSGVKDQIAGM